MVFWGANSYFIKKKKKSGSSEKKKINKCPQFTRVSVVYNIFSAPKNCHRPTTCFMYITDLLGGPLVFEVGYHPRKKIHIIRVVFQDQAMYSRTSFRCRFWSYWQILEKDMMDKLRNTHAKTCIQGLFSYLKNTCSGCVLKVHLRGWYPAWNTSAPPLRRSTNY